MTRNEAGRPWTAEDLRRLDGSHELEIATARVSGDPGHWTPIWVVVAGDHVFVRTWQRRTTGWYGRSVASSRAWIRLSGDAVGVIVTVVGDADAVAIDAAYRTKYGSGALSMVTTEAAASTLRLTRAS